MFYDNYKASFLLTNSYFILKLCNGKLFIHQYIHSFMEESVLERKLYYVPVFHDPIESDIGEYEHNKVFTEHFRNAVHDLWNFI